jgi:hypothetical protein
VPLVFISGVFVIWFSGKTKTTKILFSVLPVFLWLPGFLALMYFGTNRVTPETFLIPHNFRGKIVLYYGEPCGINVLKENDRNVYRIPQDGIMILKNPLETGIIDQEYYFVNSKGKRLSKIKMLIQQDFNEDYTLEKNKHEPPRNKVGAFLGGTGSGSDIETGKKRYQFQFIYITSWDSLRKYDDRKADSIANNILKNCRVGH